jgi:ribosomal protein S18 acetylase RimI-like enzyme
MTALSVIASIVTLVSFTTYFVMKKKTPSAWQLSVEKALGAKKSGKFQASDKNGKPVILEWLKTNVHEPAYTDTMHMIDNVFIRSFAFYEICYLKAHPEAHIDPATNTVYEEFKPYFKNGAKDPDWALVENKLISIIQAYQQQSMADEVKKYANSLFFFVLLKEATAKTILGFALYRIDDDDPQGTVTLEPLTVAPEEQQRGLGKLLTASIFKIIPIVSHLTLNVESKNDIALKAYQAWGFVEQPATEAFHKTMGYQVEQSDILQKTAKSLVPIEK